METTAEGVEDTGQLDMLRGEGCANIQGYLFSLPVESGRIAELLENRISQAA